MNSDLLGDHYVSFKLINILASYMIRQASMSRTKLHEVQNMLLGTWFDSPVHYRYIDADVHKEKKEAEMKLEHILFNFI